MSDHTKILKHIENSTDIDGLKRQIRRAKEQGAKEVEEAAFRRLISIVPDAEPGTVEHDFWTTVHAFEQVLSEERDGTTRLARTRQKVARVGVIETLKDWALGKETDGFKMLVERGMPELTGEAIVVRHAKLFSDEVVAAAKAKLQEIGFPA